jgi:AcrR family transcriptional regulator
MAAPRRDSRGRRPYRSPGREGRAQHTRSQIVSAATTQFAAAGFAAATIPAIAELAGVSVPTVELYFGTKPNLLKEAIDVAIAGDYEPIPMLARDWARASAAERDPRRFLEAFSSALTDSAARSAPLIVVAHDAARADADIAQLVRRLSRQRAVTVAWLVDGLRDRVELRDGLSRSEAIDVLWLLMDPVLFDRLTRERRWTTRHFERWFTDAVLRLLLP